MLCKVVNSIYQSNPIRDRNNKRIFADTPACTPQELVKLTLAHFALLLDKQKTRLVVTMSEQNMASLENEFQLLRKSYRYQETLQKLAIERLPPDAILRLPSQFLSKVADSITLWNSLEDSLVHSHKLPIFQL